MPATIRLTGGCVLTVHDLKWTSETCPDIAESLNFQQHLYATGPWDPDRDLTEARRVLDTWGGGEVTAHTEPEPGAEGTVY